VRRHLAGRSLVAAALVSTSVVVALAGCGKKSSKAAPEVVGLAAVPASAQVVVSADVARIASSPIIERAVETLLLKDAELAARWEKLAETCKIEPQKLKSVVLAIGPSQGPEAGTGPVLMVVTGQLVETELAACVRSMVGEGGGTLTAKDLAGRTLYQARDGKRTMFFAFGRPDTVVLGASEAFVTEALGSGPKATDNAELVGWIKLVDHKAPLWAVGRVDDRVRAGLVKVTGGQLSAGPAAMVLAIDPGKGARLDVGAVMATADDAKTLESFAKGQLALAAMAAQARSLGKLVDKIAISSEGSVVRFKADLSIEDVNHLIKVLDDAGPPEQDSPPPTAPPGAPDAGP
jgi:hypothetical protein